MTDDSRLKRRVDSKGGIFIGDSLLGENYKLVMLDCCHVHDMTVDDILNGDHTCHECQDEEQYMIDNSYNVIRIRDYYEE
jgi:hypothetical protein